MTQQQHQAPGDLGPRFLARIIDHVIIVVIGLPIYVSVDVVSRAHLMGAFWALMMFSYCVICEATLGATPGKMVVGLPVIAQQITSTPPWRSCAIRNAFYLIGMLPWTAAWLLLGAAATVIGATINDSPSKTGKHDALAGNTQV